MMQALVVIVYLVLLRRAARLWRSSSYTAIA